MNHESKTIDVFPEEGNETRVVVIRRTVRHECAICGEAAHYKFTFLYGPNPRTNTASSAYGKDDCSYCEDDSAFACREHRHRYRELVPSGMVFCGEYAATMRWKHLFLRTIETTEKA